MTRYYVNNRSQSNGDHEVHREGCQWMPSDRQYLGEFEGCAGAVEAAKTYHHQVNGCYTCSRPCHTQ